MSNKSTVITEPYVLVTTIYDSTYALIEVAGINNIYTAALLQPGDNQIDWYLLFDTLNLIKKWLSFHEFSTTLALIHLMICLLTPA